MSNETQGQYVEMTNEDAGVSVTANHASDLALRIDYPRTGHVETGGGASDVLVPGGEGFDPDTFNSMTEESLPDIPQSSNRSLVLTALGGLGITNAALVLETGTGWARTLFGYEIKDDQLLYIGAVIVLLTILKGLLIPFWNQMSRNRHELKIESIRNLSDPRVPNINFDDEVERTKPVFKKFGLVK